MSKYGTRANFLPNYNGYSTTQTNNSETIIFTNTGDAVVAPTSYTTNYKPFFMMFGFGTILLGLIVAPIVMLRRRKEEEE